MPNFVPVSSVYYHMNCAKYGKSIIFYMMTEQKHTKHFKTGRHFQIPLAAMVTTHFQYGCHTNAAYAYIDMSFLIFASKYMQLVCFWSRYFTFKPFPQHSIEIYVG